MEDYQAKIKLKGNVYIDEMFYTVVQSELERKDNKLYRGLSKNKYCIGIACDDVHVICFVEGKAKTSSQKSLNVFKGHIEPGSVLIHDGEKAPNALIKELGLKEEFYKSSAYSKLADKDNSLRKRNHHCANLRSFLDSLPGFNRVELQDYINIFVFKTNVKGAPLSRC